VPRVSAPPTSVRIRTGFYYNTSSIEVRLGEHPVLQITKPVLLTQLDFITPVVNSTGTVAVLVSVDTGSAGPKVLTVANNTFMFYPVPSISSIYPALGSLVRCKGRRRAAYRTLMRLRQAGGTLVTVRGNFVRTPPLFGQDTVTCLFGGNATVQGQWNVEDGTTRVVCRAPRWTGSAGLVTLEVAPNGLQYSESRRQFRYFTQPTLLPPLPTLGPFVGALRTSTAPLCSDMQHVQGVHSSP
jgi:hypothetical protein